MIDNSFFLSSKKKRRKRRKEMIPSPPSKQSSNPSSHLEFQIMKIVQDVELEVSLTRRTQTRNNCGFHVCEFMRKEAQSIVSGKNPIYSKDSYSVDNDINIRKQVFSNIFAGRFLTSEEMKSELDSLQTLIKRKEIERESSVTTYFQNKVLKNERIEEANQLETDFLKKKGKIYSYLTGDNMANDLIVERYVSISNDFLSKNGIQNAFFYTPHYSDVFARNVSPKRKLLKILKDRSITSHYIPINIPSSHWLLACVHFESNPPNFDRKRKKIGKVKVRVFDSCVDDDNYSNSDSNLVKILSHFINTMLQINK